MCELERYVRELARVNGAQVVTSIEENEQKEKTDDPYRRPVSANDPLPGTETFYHTWVVDVPGFALSFRREHCRVFRERPHRGPQRSGLSSLGQLR